MEGPALKFPHDFHISDGLKPLEDLEEKFHNTFGALATSWTSTNRYFWGSWMDHDGKTHRKPICFS